MSSSDVSSVTNHFSVAAEGFITTTAGSVSSGATTVPLNATTGLTNGNVFVGIIEPGTSGKEQTFTGLTDTAGSQITNVIWTRGTNTSHSAGVTVVDYVSGTAHNMTTKGILVEHSQDGTHGNITPDSVITPTLTVTSGTTLPAGDIATADLAAGAVTNAKLATSAGEVGAAWASWTPTWANLTVGNATQSSTYIQIGKTVHFRVSLILGSTSSISPSPTFSLPVTSVSMDADQQIGHTTFVDNGTGVVQGIVAWKTTTTALPASASTTYYAGFTTSAPFAFTSGDKILCTGTYEAA
jgi:hypothetical protein